MSFGRISCDILTNAIDRSRANGIVLCSSSDVVYRSTDVDDLFLPAGSERLSIVIK